MPGPGFSLMGGGGGSWVAGDAGGTLFMPGPGFSLVWGVWSWVASDAGCTFFMPGGVGVSWVADGICLMPGPWFSQ